jgi:hypothetical protein
MKAIVLAILAIVVSQCAFAQYHHGRGGYGYGGYRGHGYYGPRVGVYLGSPYLGAPYPWYPPAPSYYYPPSVVYSPVVTVREAPTVYIEQEEVIAPSAPARQSFESGYWYYCQERSAYYPTVDSCPSPWQKVAPTVSKKR